MVTLHLPLAAAIAPLIDLKAPISRYMCNDRKPPLKAPSFVSLCLLRSSYQQPLDLVPLNPPANQSVAAIIFGDGSSESQLWPLTKRRSAGAIPIAAKYRLIDAVVSNCINSSITKIYALTQFNSTSLNSHLSKSYSNMGLGKEGLVEVIAAYQSFDNHDWFQGNVDAIRRCLWVLEEYPIMEVLILPGHHLYRMDYQKLIQAHRKSKADITISALVSGEKGDKGYGTLKVNSQNLVLEINDGKVHRHNELLFPPVSCSRHFEELGCINLASMGIYVVNRNLMVKMLREFFPKANHFKGDLLPGAISLGMKVQAYPYHGNWENMESIKAYYEANMDFTKRERSGYKLSSFRIYDKESLIYTLPRCLPPTKLTDAVITDSIIGDGCILNSCTIRSSVVGLRTKIGDGAVVEDSIIMGFDFYHEDMLYTGTDKQEIKNIPVGIGEGALIRKAIIDKNARIGRHVMIMNKDGVQEANKEAYGYVIKDGIVIVVKNAIIPDRTVL